MRGDEYDHQFDRHYSGGPHVDHREDAFHDDRDLSDASHSDSDRPHEYNDGNGSPLLTVPIQVIEEKHVKLFRAIAIAFLAVAVAAFTIGVATGLLIVGYRLVTSLVP